MKRYLILLFMVNVNAVFAQAPDTLNKAEEKKAHWLVGVDVRGGLADFSLLSGLQFSRSRLSVTGTHMYGSTRFGLYYDHYLVKKWRLLGGVGGHCSFRFRDFGVPENEYRDSLIRTQQEAKTMTIGFLPGRETRVHYFFSIAASKEFRLCKSFYINIKLMAVYGYNPTYKNGEFSPWIGLQFYYSF